MTLDRPFAPRRFAVAWRNTELQRIYPVGMLESEEGLYRFWYVPDAESIDGFRPFLGFPDFMKTYQSEKLWPFFALRVMDSRRPDYGPIPRPPCVAPVSIAT